MTAQAFSLKRLVNASIKFDNKAQEEKNNQLHAIIKSATIKPADIPNLANALLFIAAYPGNPQQAQATAHAIAKVTSRLKTLKGTAANKLADEGLPYMPLIPWFSHDHLCWLITLQSCKIELIDFNEEGFELNQLLKFTLPIAERFETTSGNYNYVLLNALKVKKQHRLEFLLNEFKKLNHVPYIKDYLWEQLNLEIKITPKAKSFSRFYNRFLMDTEFYSSELLKRFDHKSLLALPLPEPVALTRERRIELIGVIKNSLALTMRETDPVTYMDQESLRFYTLERGISIALYGMTPERQLPFDSYMGYTLFKNGYPAAYGGSWIFGQAAEFGLNIFESFRGGESGYILCQLLRTYIHAFGLTYIEVDAHQFGKDNPDGIQSGAFWFYYRYGFRPVKPALAKLALLEKNKMKVKEGYRSSKAILLRFTEGNVALNIKPYIPLKSLDVAKKISASIAKTNAVNRPEAEEKILSDFLLITGISGNLNGAKLQVARECSQLASCLSIDLSENLNSWKNLIEEKGKDPYLYNKTLTKLLSLRKTS